MADIIELLGFNRLVHVLDNNCRDDENVVREQARDFGIDSVYFCTDENHSYPALFLKKISEFDSNNLQKIAKIQQFIWNYKKVLFLYIYTDTELRIYNCIKKPIVVTKQTDFENEIKKLEIISATITDKEKLNILTSLFSAIAVDTGIIWTLEEAHNIREKINIQTRVDRFLVESLIRTAKKLCDDGLDFSIVHRLLLRSLFLLYLEDRGATDKNYYAKINKYSDSYFSILDNVEDTYKLYDKLNKNFNGGLFDIIKNEEKKIKRVHLQLIKNCFAYGYDGTPQTELFSDWRIFNFKIIQIELLSEIYESFLSEMEPENKHQTGAFYTPPSLVEFILNEKLPINKIYKEYNMKILDPACGSGIFLVECFKRLIKRYENHHNEKLTDYAKLKKLLLDNIFGIDINPNALKIAAFSLYLALLDNLDPKTLWQGRKLPYLINDNDLPEDQKGNNLFKSNTIKKNQKIDKMHFDLVIGNPPFGTNQIDKTISNYCKKHGFAQEQVLPFLHKATIFSPNGDIALIFNTKVLTNNLEPYSNFRKWLFNSCYVEKIYNFSILRNAPENYGGKLFNASSSPICIVFYRKESPKEPLNRITYYAPKTFIKSNVLDGIVIDDYDVSYLPREECQKADTKIWKIAMWGGEGDIELINRLSYQTKNIKHFMKIYDIKSGVGFGLYTHDEGEEPKESEELAKIKYMDADCITRYYTPKSSLRNVKASIKTKKQISYYKELYGVDDVSDIKELRHFRRFGKIEAYNAPHLLVKKGLENNKLCASFIDVKCSFTDGVSGFYTKDSDILKALMAYINSRLSTYFIFMTNSSYGIEREQIMKKEYLTIPINLTKEDIDNIANIISSFIMKIKENYFFENTEPPYKILNKIENIIYKSLNLTTKDVAVINDAIDYTLDLFHNKDVSNALRPVKDIMPYVEMICREINDFIAEQNLFANSTIYTINYDTPLVILKLSFAKEKIEIIHSNEKINNELERINQYLWKQSGGSIYFRKKMNYYDGDDIYIIRPNQKRFWTQSAAINDATEIILECLKGN